MVIDRTSKYVMAKLFPWDTMASAIAFLEEFIKIVPTVAYVFYG